MQAASVPSAERMCRKDLQPDPQIRHERSDAHSNVRTEILFAQTHPPFLSQRENG